MTAIAPWFCLRALSGSPGFESLAHHLHLFPICSVELYLFNEDRNEKMNEKEAGIGSY